MCFIVGKSLIVNENDEVIRENITDIYALV